MSVLEHTGQLMQRHGCPVVLANVDSRADAEPAPAPPVLVGALPCRMTKAGICVASEECHTCVKSVPVYAMTAVKATGDMACVTSTMPLVDWVTAVGGTLSMSRSGSRTTKVVERFK